jgi:glycosyltransferase involved in cell wall biosynthesis
MTTSTVTPDLSIVIATYNEAAYLERNVAAIRAVLDQTRYTYELLFIDDLSQDDTARIVRHLQSLHPETTRAFFHSRNLGRGATVSEGITAAAGRYVGFLDIDLEISAGYIPAMILALEQGHDVATAWRISKLDVRRFHRLVLSHGYRRLSRWMLGHSLIDTEAGFKFFHTERILPVLARLQNTGWFWDTEIMLESQAAGLRIIEIPCVFRHRRDSVSTVRLTSDVWHYLVQLVEYRRRR